MSDNTTSQFDAIWRQVSAWPPDQRRKLADELYHSVEKGSASQLPRNKSLMNLRGLLKTDGPPPDDEACRRILEDELLRKYG